MYIKALGSTCYDRTGITFPDRKAIDFKQMPGIKGGGWEYQFGWGNQPMVFTFECRGKNNRKAAEQWLDAQCPNPSLPCLLIVRSW